MAGTDKRRHGGSGGRSPYGIADLVRAFIPKEEIDEHAEYDESTGLYKDTRTPKQKKRFENVAEQLNQKIRLLKQQQGAGIKEVEARGGEERKTLAEAAKLEGEREELRTGRKKADEASRGLDLTRSLINEGPSTLSIRNLIEGTSPENRADILRTNYGQAMGTEGLLASPAANKARTAGLRLEQENAERTLSMSDLMQKAKEAAILRGIVEAQETPTHTLPPSTISVYPGGRSQMGILNQSSPNIEYEELSAGGAKIRKPVPLGQTQKPIIPILPQDEQQLTGGGRSSIAEMLRNLSISSQQPNVNEARDTMRNPPQETEPPITPDFQEILEAINNWRKSKKSGRTSEIPRPPYAPIY